MQNINNNINFRANLNISKVTTNKKRWTAIAEDFKKRTTQYTKTDVDVKEVGDKLHIYSYNGKTGAEVESILSSKNTKDLLKMKNSEIVKQLRFLLCKANKYAKLQNKGDEIVFDTMKTHPHIDEDKLALSFSNELKSYIEHEIQKNPFWKDVKNILFG